jgi:hypothetical protein
MVPYAPFPGEQSLLPPGQLKDTRYFYFLLNADAAKTQELVDRTFNDRLATAGRGQRYYASNLVLLTFSHVDGLTSGDPASGTIIYKDIAFWMPVWKRSPILDLAPDCLFPPYIFVDNVATMATGREVFGLPKQLGRFRMPEKLEDLAEAPDPAFTVEVVGTIRRGGVQDWHKLASVRRVGGPAVGRGPDPIAPFRYVQAALGAAHDQRGIALPRWLGATRALGLKQLRDVARPQEACYQAIVEAPLVAERVRETCWLTDRYEVKFEDLDSHPVMETFGLAEGWQPVEGAIYLRADMVLQPGEEVWRAP